MNSVAVPAEPKPQHPHRAGGHIGHIWFRRDCGYEVLAARLAASDCSAPGAPPEFKVVYALALPSRADSEAARHVTAYDLPPKRKDCGPEERSLRMRWGA